MGRLNRRTSFSERKNPVTAAILAVLPAILGIAVLLVSNGRAGFSFLYGGVGMLYVGRWMKASLILLAFDLVTMLAFKWDATAGFVLIIVRIAFTIVVFPIWAVMSVREYNELVDGLDSTQSQAAS